MYYSVWYHAARMFAGIDVDIWKHNLSSASKTKKAFVSYSLRFTPDGLFFFLPCKAFVDKESSVIS